MPDNVIRQDVIQIGFDTNLKVLTEILTQLDDIKKAANGTGETDGLDKVKKQANGANETAQKLNSTLKKVGSTLGTVAKKAAGFTLKATTAGITACATAVGTLTAKSVSAYGELEQLQGGVKKIFDEANISGIMKDANNAYKNLGMSANEYLTSINNVGATFASTMGDQKGYDTAKLGMQAISDFATGTGKSVDELTAKYMMITRSTSVYQSIADQFSGILPATSADFLKQAQAAGYLSEKYEKLTNVPVAEYQEAVTKMLEKGTAGLGLTGNTVTEATKTITGSISMMESAWGNLLPAFVSGGDELDQCIENFVDSVIVVGENIIPAVEKSLGGIGTLIDRIVPIVEKQLPGLIESLLPPLIRAGTSLFVGLVKSLPKLVEIVIKELPNVAKILGDGIREAFGNDSFVVKAFDKVGEFCNWIKDNAEKVKKVAIGAGAAIGGIFIAVKGFQAFKSISSIFSSIGQSGDSVQKGEGPLSSLAKTKPTTILKGLLNLAIIIGGLVILAAALMKIAPYMAELSDFKSILKIVAVMAILGLLGTGLAWLAGKIGNIPVATVAKGLANMAIVLVGFGALAAVFLWLSPYIAGLGDFNSLLKVVAVMGILGILGTALSILAGIVGMIPIATVALGLANMAIVLVGFGALAAVFLWLAPYIAALGDMQSILKVVAIMTILGTVGAVLSIFAGIVGMIPIPVVLAGLANMALVLGGISGIIVAFGALNEIPGFADFIANGGEILVKICNILGEMVGSLLGGAIEGLSNALPALGENLGKFGENIKPLFASMQGVNMEGVGTFFTSLIGLLGIATGNEIVEGIKSFFGGGEESSLSKLGTQLTDFANNSKGFFDTVSALPENGFTNGTKLFECLAGLKGLPQEGGVVSWFTGNISYESISNGLKQLSNENISGFFAFAAGLNQNGFDKATALFECLAGLKSLPEDGGVVGWFMGETDYSKLAQGLGHLSSEGVKNFFAMVKGLNQKTFDNTTKLFTSLSEIDKLEVPKSGGFLGIGGESTLNLLATELTNFVTNTETFFTKINELNIDNLKELLASLGDIDDAISSLKGASETEFSAIVDTVKGKCDEIVRKLKSTLKQIKSTISNTNLKPSGAKMMNSFVNGITSKKAAVLKAITSITDEITKKLNNVISGGNWTLKQFGSSERLEAVPYARGTGGHRGGNAIVNDGRGAELVQMPNGNTFIPNGRNVFLPNAPKGMKVLDAQRTARLFGKSSPTFRYANGTGDIDVWGHESGKTLAKAVADEFVNYNGLSGYALHASTAAVNTAKGAMSSWATKVIDEFGAKGLGDYVASAGVEQWRSTVIKALKMEGQYTAANVKRTLYQMQTESGGNPRAINLWDSNAKKGIPSKGLMQVIDPTFKAYARAGFNSNIYDPLSNILASIRYAVSRYGTLTKAYQGHGYSSGVGGDSITLPQYSPANAVTSTNTVETEHNSYAPVFNLTIHGASDERALASKVKKWVAEAMEDCFEGMARRNATT